MQILPIDLTALAAVILGTSIVLIPVIGLTARFALKPVVEALSRLFESRGMTESMRVLERRIALQEQEIEALQDALRGLGEAREFERQLSAPPSTPPTQPVRGSSDV